MKKWIFLLLLTGLLLVVDHFWRESMHLNEDFRITVFFFAVQTLVLFRLDQWAPKEWSVQVSLVKITVRFLASLTFIAIMIYRTSDAYTTVVQFISLYLIFMIFEIVIALTNLRRN